MATGGVLDRPVLGGSLKSLALMRECPKARSDWGGFFTGDKGTNLRVLHPADPEPSLQSNLEV